MISARHATALSMMLLFAACGDSAENNDANNGATNNGATNNGATNNGAAVPSFADDVAPILIASCALNGCHLDPGNGTAFMIGATADVAAVQTALEGVETGGGVAMVVGGDLDNSELYLRITGTGRAKMPFGGELAPAEIDTITAWIEGGAAF